MEFELIITFTCSLTVFLELCLTISILISPASMVFCRGASKEPIQQLCSPHTHNHYFLIPSTSASAPPIYEQIDSSSQSPNTSQTTITSAHPIRSDPWTPIGFSSIVPSAPPLPSHYTVLPEIHSSVADINNGTHSLPPSPKNPEPSLGRRVKTAPLIGRRAARFEISSPKLTRKLQKATKKPFNPILLTNRGCTDVCCCMLFSVFLAGWAAVAFLGELLDFVNTWFDHNLCHFSVDVGQAGALNSSDGFTR